VAWSRVQWPLQLGYLGVLGLKLMGRALRRLRWLWLQRVDPSKPWIPRCKVGDGNLTLFRLDPWMDGRCITDLTPDLVAAVHPGSGIVGWWWQHSPRTCGCQIFLGALTLPVLLQYVHVRESLESITLDPSSPDSIVWR
jgi:hypothetical protein